MPARGAAEALDAIFIELEMRGHRVQLAVAGRSP